MASIYCADCGTGCALVDGREVDPHDPEIADVRVWACPECPCAWAHHAAAADAPAAVPAGAETRHAREVLAERLVLPLVHEGSGGLAGAQALAIDRLTNFLAYRMGIEPDECEVARFSLEQCRQAWRELRGVRFADVLAHAQRHRGAKRRASASGDGVAA
ncbi:hypothetical protein [Methylobacterium brachiatum]|uniref:hypothetical protein n=1 Tax=Methylobacterium brachiatum TaxID=269660 RepID=UPI002449B514|nr:hypothetical protein [Methylobacterium brachiatum]MDH2313071.1 hypothetical protein [Methylobacterium brachiatum]